MRWPGKQLKGLEFYFLALRLAVCEHWSHVLGWANLFNSNWKTFWEMTPCTLHLLSLWSVRGRSQRRLSFISLGFLPVSQCKSLCTRWNPSPSWRTHRGPGPEMTIPIDSVSYWEVRMQAAYTTMAGSRQLWRVGSLDPSKGLLSYSSFRNPVCSIGRRKESQHLST